MDSRVVEFFETHRKFFVALAAAAAVAVAVFTDDRHVDLTDVLAVVAAFAGAGGVVATPNKTRRRAQAERAVDEVRRGR